MRIAPVASSLPPLGAHSPKTLPLAVDGTAGEADLDLSALTITHGAPAAAGRGRKAASVDGETRKKLRMIFDKFDEDKSGAVSTGEMTKMVQELGLSLSDDEIAKLMQEADPDASGQIEVRARLPHACVPPRTVDARVSSFAHRLSAYYALRARRQAAHIPRPAPHSCLSGSSLLCCFMLFYVVLCCFMLFLRPRLAGSHRLLGPSPRTRPAGTPSSSKSLWR